MVLTWGVSRLPWLALPSSEGWQTHRSYALARKTHISGVLSASLSVVSPYFLSSYLLMVTGLLIHWLGSIMMCLNRKNKQINKKEAFFPNLATQSLPASFCLLEVSHYLAQIQGESGEFNSTFGGKGVLKPSQLFQSNYF